MKKENWTFLLGKNKFGLGELFTDYIKILYTTARATVIRNGVTSPHFTLEEGTRQGCPVSPSLFAIFIVLLAAATETIKWKEFRRPNNDIKLFYMQMI